MDTISIKWIILNRSIYNLDMRHSYRQLQVFIATARHGTLSRAATAIALSQSAASTALSEFERQFDTRLFDRIGKSLHLNARGQQLLPRAQELLDRAAELEAMMTGDGGMGALKVGATLTIGNYLATLIVAGFLRQHADSQVRLEVRNTAAILGHLACLELDLGLIEGHCTDPQMEVEPWIADRLAIFCAPDHPLAAAGSVPLDALLDQDWILREPGSGTREACADAFGKRFPQLRIRLELEHTEAIKRAVEAGLGIGCISRLALRDALRRGSLVAIDCPDLDLERQFYFVWHRQKFQTAAMREFLARCRSLTAGVRYSDQIELPAVP